MRDLVVDTQCNYAIFLDNVEIDKYVKSFSTNASIDGSIGTATVEMVYLPDLYKVTHAINASAKSTVKDTASITTSSSGNTYNIDSWPSLLLRGSGGTHVAELQAMLASLGYSEVGAADGSFGPKTQSAVTRFQKAHGLSTDGIVGPNTKAALKSMVKTVSKSSSTSGSSIVIEDGIENMTNLKIFIQNVYTGKFCQVFDGNVKTKSLVFSGGEYSLSIQAYDYLNWMTKTICPIAIPLTDTLTPGDRLKWKAQGIDINKVNTVNTINDINFKGKNISEVWKTISDQTMNSNLLYTTSDSVAKWDNVLSRVTVMGDIDDTLRHQEVMDFMISTSVASANSVYVFMNDIIKSLLFEFYQDRDSAIRIKPPFWNEHVLRNFVIDPSLIMSFNENVNWNNLYTRVLVTGGVEDWQQDAVSQDDVTKSILTPVVAYTSSGVSGDAGPIVVTSADSGTLVEGNGGTGAQVAAYAQTFIGVPYKWGGTDPSGFDCSGLVQYAYAHFGISIPRVTTDQINSGVGVSQSELQAGDLVFFSIESHADHVGMYVSGGQMVVARHSGTNVQMQNISDVGTPCGCRRIASGGTTSTGSLGGGVSTGMPTSVGPDALLNLTYLEKKYGPSIYDTTQPLIKFSTSSAIDNSTNAYSALTKYARFMLNYLNASVSIAGLQTSVAMPWLRAGFNTWVDPYNTDKIFYITGVSHQGSAGSGCYTSLSLIMGRNRADFCGNSASLGALKPGCSDDIFVSSLKVKPENFGPVCDYAAVSKACKAFYDRVADSEHINTIESSYFKYLYNDPVTMKSNYSPTSSSSSSAITITTPSNNISSWPNILQNGSSGTYVKELQNILLGLGYSQVGSADGSFGPKTKSGVISFQRNKKLRWIDGICGSETKRALQSSCGSTTTTTSSSSSSSISSWRYILKQGCVGNDVKQLQQLLYNMAYREVTWVDGSFGPKTYQAVTHFQRDHHCSVDGEVGPETRTALSNLSKSADGGVLYRAYPATAVFDGEYTIAEIQSKLNTAYASAPSIVKARAQRLSSILKNSVGLANDLYSIF